MGTEFSEKVIEHIKKKGPSLPIEISSTLGGNTLFAGAILSELVSRKIVLISNAKIGGSPVYYLKGQEDKLIYLRKYLSERPRMAFDMLKEHLVLHDKSCEPWQRVALREIKDFAFPFEVEINGNKELFWRWYLISEDEAKKKIFEKSSKTPDLKSEEKESEPEPKKEEPKVEETKPEEPKVEEIKKEEPKKEEVKPEETKKEEVKPEETKKEVKDTQKKLEIEKDTSIKLPTEKDEFYNIIFEFFMENEIKVLKQNEIKKGKEIHFQIELPTKMGNVPFIVLAKEKKKINQKDLSLAFSQLYHHKMPIIYLSTGELAKTGEKFLKEELKGIIFKKI